jgi:hypothetical protein
MRKQGHPCFLLLSNIAQTAVNTLANKCYHAIMKVIEELLLSFTPAPPEGEFLWRLPVGNKLNESPYCG